MTVAGAGAAKLLPVSPISETHQLLVGQRLYGWPQVEAVDVHGVIVRDVIVQFTASGAASFEGAVEVKTNNRGRAMASDLLGDSVGQATVVATLPSSPDAAALEYTVEVVDSA
jgi:hypothetical protein